jgi:hypothetical protein
MRYRTDNEKPKNSDPRSKFFASFVALTISAMDDPLQLLVHQHYYNPTSNRLRWILSKL